MSDDNFLGLYEFAFNRKRVVILFFKKTTDLRAEGIVMFSADSNYPVGYHSNYFYFKHLEKIL